MSIDRRTLVTSLTALIGSGALGPVSPVAAQKAVKRLKLLLNTSFSGPQAWFLLAEDLGYFRREGIELDMTTGAGAYTAAPRFAGGSFDFG